MNQQRVRPQRTTNKSGRVPFSMTLAPRTMEELDIMSEATATPINYLLDDIIQEHMETWKARQQKGNK